MNTTLAIGLIVFGVALILTRGWSAELHERWNQKLTWTQWATGPQAMRASRVANVLVGVGLIVLGLVVYAAGK
jgi:drug/metabolite transporter (DMT)-like permease